MLSDRAGHVLAVAARSPADEQALLADSRRGRGASSCASPTSPSAPCACAPGASPSTALLRLVTTLVASEVERAARARPRLRGRRGRGFLRALLDARALRARGRSAPRAGELGLDLDGRRERARRARAHAHVPAEDGWRRARILSVVERGARASCAGAIAALDGAPRAAGRRGRSCCSGSDDAAAARAAESVRRELQARCPATPSRVGPQPAVHRPGRAAPRRQRGAARRERRRGRRRAPRARLRRDRAPTACCCRAMAEDPAELQRFYAETVEPLVAYDEQYETGLVHDGRGLPRGRRQRRRHRAAPVHAPPHDPLPAGARARALRPRRRLHRRTREALASVSRRCACSASRTAAARPARPGPAAAASRVGIRYDIRPTAGWNIRPVSGVFRKLSGFLPSAP